MSILGISWVNILKASLAHVMSSYPLLTVFLALLYFMGLHDGRNYEKKTHQCSQADLQYITADQIYHWETFRMYENPDADEGIVPLQHYHHSVIGWKRKTSYSVPSNHIA